MCAKSKMKMFASRDEIHSTGGLKLAKLRCMDWVGLAHFLTALLAIATGAVVVLRPKGTKFHRTVGRVYLAAMLAVNVSALAIYELFGGFGPFHAAAVINRGTAGDAGLARLTPRPGRARSRSPGLQLE